MPTKRTKAELMEIFEDNNTQQITEQDLRDFIESVYYRNITTVDSATYDLADDDYILHTTYTATGAVAITLPTTTEERIICIKDTGNASVNNITIDTEGSETIDGSDTYTLDIDYEYIWLYSDGSNWFIN